MNRIKELRAAARISQTELGALLNTTGVTVGRYEAEKRALDPETICKLCEVFDCTADYLLGRSDIRAYNLKPSEIQLLIAYRAADVRAREMVELALRPFAPDTKKTETA